MATPTKDMNFLSNSSEEEEEFMSDEVYSRMSEVCANTNLASCSRTEKVSELHSLVLKHNNMKKVVLQRLILITRLHHHSADRTQLGAHYEKLNSELSKQHIVDEITGLLLIYPSCLLHVIESSGDVLTSVLEDQKALQQQPNCNLLETKILFLAHNIESRLFKEWSYKVMDKDQVVGSTGVRGLEDDDEKTEHLFCSVLSTLQKLGEHLQRPPKALPGLVLDKTPALIIPQRTLEKLLHQDEFMSPEQYLQLYKSPLNINTEFGHLTAGSLLSFT